jgi:UDP-GlcNAc:undecaprenyl-phosphate/decaprenyl-phosphate GlcNAc-1-phosphate transferase
VFNSWVLVVAGFALALSLALGFIAVAPSIGCIDKPDKKRKYHERPTALTGGVVVMAMLLGSHAVGALPWELGFIDWAAIISMFTVGILDDRFSLLARYKAIVGFGIALVLAMHSTLSLHQSPDQIKFLLMTFPNHVFITFPILFFWFWSIPQAFNLIDGINGLSIGFGLMALCTLGWHGNAHPYVLYGGLLAVLVLNFPRARHFLGDCGTMVLGTLLAILCVKRFVPATPNMAVWIFAYPIIDVCMVVAIRISNGAPVYIADRSHLHYWMMDRLGNRAWLVTPILWLLAALPMLRGANLPGATVLSSGGALLLVLLACRVYRDRLQPRPRKAVIPPLRDSSFRSGSNTGEPGGSHRVI